MRFRRIPASAVLMLVGASDACAQPVRDRIVRIDVVELVEGERVDGSDAHAVTHGTFTYWFADEVNRKSFEQSPEAYEVQLGGACARMGPLTGEGSTRIIAAHDGKVYLFASEACKARFLESPDAFLATEDPAPQSTEESRALGRKMLGRAVDAIMCHAWIDGVTTYRETLAREEESGGRTYRVTTTTTLMKPSGVSHAICWDETCWDYIGKGDTAWQMDGDGVKSLHAQQRDELMREAGRHPYMVLWARDSKDLIATSEGEKRTIEVPGEGEVEVELVTVHLHGATSTLGLDEGGRVRLLAYRGRGPNATIGEVEKLYSAFHVLDEMRVPGHVDTYFNGERVEKASGAFVEQVFDDPADAAKFERPKELAAAAGQGAE